MWQVLEKSISNTAHEKVVKLLYLKKYMSRTGVHKAVVRGLFACGEWKCQRTTLTTILVKTPDIFLCNEIHL